MKKTYLIASIILVTLIASVFFWLGRQSSAPTPLQSGSRESQVPAPSSSASQGQQSQVSSNSQSAPTSTASVSERYTIHANDSGADLTKILTLQGDVVQITFMVDATGTYHGGLDFRSPVVSTGPISPGDSKTIVFTATQPFAFTPYWPSTNVQKPYTITVGVGIP